MNRLFSDFERRLLIGLPSFQLKPETASSTPAMTVEDKGEVLILSVDIPGMTQGDIGLRVEGESLIVKGVRRVGPPRFR